MLKKTLSLTIIAALITVVVLAITPQDLHQERFLPALLAIGSATTVFALGAAWFFVTGLDTFRPQFKWAYYILCAGIVLLALSQLQLPLLSLANALNSWWVSTGIVVVPFLLSTMLLYAGVYRMATILGITLWAAKLRFVIPFTLVIIAISSLLPHLRITTSAAAEFNFDVFAGLLAVSAAFNLMSFLITRKLKEQLGDIYAPAMKWLSWFYIFNVFAACLELAYTFLFPEYTWYTIYGINLVPLLISSIGTMIAGVQFNAISRTRFINDATFIDVVASAAELASDPKQVTPYLNTIKAINTVLSKGEEPSPTQKRLLATVYLQIESYLTSSQESVRHFSKEQLRAQLPASFVAIINQTSSISR